MRFLLNLAEMFDDRGQNPARGLGRARVQTKVYGIGGDYLEAIIQECYPFLVAKNHEYYHIDVSPCLVKFVQNLKANRIQPYLDKTNTVVLNKCLEHLCKEDGQEHYSDVMNYMIQNGGLSFEFWAKNADNVVHYLMMMKTRTFEPTRVRGERPDIFILEAISRNVRS